MKELEEKSGAWRCRWVQFSHTGVEDIQLGFESGKISGSGRDPQGGFSYSGTYDPEGAVRLTKEYVYMLSPAPSSMTYVGVWDGTMIVGEWVDDTSWTNYGPFEMWPIDGEAVIPQTLMQESAEVKPL